MGIRNLFKKTQETIDLGTTKELEEKRKELNKMAKEPTEQKEEKDEVIEVIQPKEEPQKIVVQEEKKEDEKEIFMEKIKEIEEMKKKLEIMGSGINNLPKDLYLLKLKEHIKENIDNCSNLNNILYVFDEYKSYIEIHQEIMNGENIED